MNPKWNLCQTSSSAGNVVQRVNKDSSVSGDLHSLYDRIMLSSPPTAAPLHSWCSSSRRASSQQSQPAASVGLHVGNIMSELEKRLGTDP